MEGLLEVINTLLIFWVAAILISTSIFASTATETAILSYFYPYSPAVITRWYKWTF